MQISKFLEKPNKFNIFYLLRNFSKIYLNIFKSICKFKKIIIFDVNELGYLEHIKNYILIANSFNSVDIYLVTRDIYVKNPKIVQFNKPIFPARFLKFIFFVDFYISPSTDNINPRGSYFIHVFHNQPIKYLSYPEAILSKIEEHFVWGPFMKKWMEDMLLSKSQKAILTNIGNPRIDEEHKKVNFTKKREKFRIGYAPSWDEGLSLRTCGLDIIESLSSSKSSIIDIRLHPCSIVSRSHNEYSFYTGKIDWITKIKKLSLKNILFSQDTTTINYLSKLDVLITDVSSISFDAYLLDIPVIFFHTNEFWKNYSKSVYKKYTLENKNIFLEKNEYLNGGRSGGIVVSTIKDLKIHVNKIKNNEDPSQFKRNQIASSLLFNKGKSSLAIKKRLEELIYLKT